MRTRWLGVVLAAAAGAAQAQTESPTAGKVGRPVPSEFIRAGAGFGCVFPRGMSAEAVDAAGMRECLRLGPLQIGMSRTAAEAIAGKVVARAEDGRGVNHIYPLQWSADGDDAVLSTYLALRFDAADRVEMIQISGPPTPARRWAFSSVALGDDERVLRERMGAPFRTEPVAFNGAQLWSYGVWPFSFEVKDSKVISIRLRTPDPDA